MRRQRSKPAPGSRFGGRCERRKAYFGLRERVCQVIREERLILPRARVLVALSGGPDSVALLYLLRSLVSRMRLKLFIAHLDHQLRRESAEDANFVSTLAERLNLPVCIERRDVASECRAHGWSLEDGARRIRYKYFLEAAHRYSAGVVALGHTSDDQAETVLMRLLRGAGSAGLRGIPIKRQLSDVRIVRPVLLEWRKDLVAYLEDLQVSYRQDATNEDRRFVRNRVRHELLPELASAYNPNIKRCLTHLAEQCSAERAFLEKAAARQWKRLAKTNKSQVLLNRGRLIREPLAMQRQIVRQAIQAVRGDLNQFEFRHWLEIEDMLRARPEGAIVDLPGGLRMRGLHDRIVCELKNGSV